MKSSVVQPGGNLVFNFPPIPRRPLRSQTYSTLVRILSHCTALQSSQQLPVEREAEDPNVTVGCDLKGSVSLESVVPQESLAGFVDGDIHERPKEVNCFDPMVVEIEGNGKVGDGSGVDPVDSCEENNAHIVNVRDIVHMEETSCTVVGHEGIIEQKLDKLPILDDYEVHGDLVLDMDTLLEDSAPLQQGDDTSFNEERNISVELQMKEKEFEELICSSTAVNSSLCNGTAYDIEEGEISGDMTMDFLFDEALSLSEGKAHDGHGSENQTGAMGFNEIDISSSHSLEKVHNNNDMLETQSTTKHLDANKEPFSCEGKVEINDSNKSDTDIEIGQILEQVVEVKYGLTEAAKDLASQRKIISKNTIEDRDLLIYEQDFCVGIKEKKRKRGLSKEKKAKKKQKERIKRAENNRKLGVKRLKLQPVVKQKKVTYCRHYLKGRCQEGEKCKFSHDTTPLTKSTPCCHFARRSCMKGDDCPYDHQLSKYPCNNYITNGNCHRGDDCMFSHEISVTEGSLTASNISKADMKSPLQNSDLNPKKQMNLHGITHQQFDSNSKSMEKSTARSSERILAKDPQKPSAAPKGISMISLVGSSSDSKHDKSPMLAEGNVVNLDQKPCIDPLNGVQKSKEVPNRVTPRLKGINFLSFGKSPLNASQIDGHHRVGKSLLGELNRSNIFDLPSSSNRAPKFGSDSRQSSLDVDPSKNVTANMISDACMPQGVKFLSFGKISEDNTFAVGVEQSGSLPNNVNKALPCSQGRGNTFGGPKFSIDVPQGLACSSNPFSLCSDNSSTRISDGMSISLKESLLSNTPKSALKALNSTVAFAAKFDSQIKLGPCTSDVRSKMTIQDGSNLAK